MSKMDELKKEFQKLKSKAVAIAARIAKDRDELRSVVEEMDELCSSIADGIEETEEALENLDRALDTMSQLV